MLNQIHTSRLALRVGIERKLGDVILSKEVHLSYLTCTLKWPSLALVCSSLNFFDIYWLILYLVNQIIDISHIPINQVPGNEGLNNVITNVAFGDAGFNGPSINISENTTLVHCKGCKKNCHPELFHDPIRNRTFKQCTDCRRRDFNRRHPESLLDQQTTRPQDSIACECKIQLVFFLLINSIKYTITLRVLQLLTQTSIIMLWSIAESAEKTVRRNFLSTLLLRLYTRHV